MKKMTLKISRRERVYLIVGGIVLFFGIAVYPAMKAAKNFRQEQLDMLELETPRRPTGSLHRHRLARC